MRRRIIGRLQDLIRVLSLEFHVIRKITSIRLRVKGDGWLIVLTFVCFRSPQAEVLSENHWNRRCSPVQVCSASLNKQLENLCSSSVEYRPQNSSLLDLIFWRNILSSVQISRRDFTLLYLLNNHLFCLFHPSSPLFSRQGKIDCFFGLPLLWQDLSRCWKCLRSTLYIIKVSGTPVNILESSSGSPSRNKW